MASYIILVYGMLVIVGGVVGFVKSGSVPSIIAGSAFGILIIGSALLTLKENVVGWYAALTCACFLAVFFGFRYYGSHKFMPAGLMIILSVVAIITILLSLRK